MDIHLVIHIIFVTNFIYGYKKINIFVIPDLVQLYQNETQSSDKLLS